jgi:16S rRNA (cytosine1402-N4)-methyltransferase
MRMRDEGSLRTTTDLRRAVLRGSGPRRKHGIDPATRTFQALRIAVNRELDQVADLLETLPELLAEDGVAVVISFHSLEDRLVKYAFRDNPRLLPLTKRPQVPSDEEQKINPRCRSAKLRAARYVPRAPEEQR